MESTSTRKPCFLKDDNGLASIADNTFSSSSGNQHNLRCPHHHLLLSGALCSPRKTSSKNYASSILSSPRSGRVLNGRFAEQQPYFLDACFLCKKPICGNTDIFMYRGDTAFCSEECRTKQIDRDESLNISSSNKTSKKYPIQSGAVAAA